MEKISTRLMSVFMGALVLITGAFASISVGAEEAEPVITTATYGAWTLRCIDPEEQEKTCETLHNIQIQGQPGPIAQVAVGRPEADGDIHLAIRVPLDIWIPAGVLVTVPEDGEAAALEIVRCMPTSCIGDGLFAGDLMDRFGEAEVGTITFQGPDKQPISLPFPLEGFRGAFAAMEK